MVSDGLDRPVRLPQEITFAAMTVMRAHSMTTRLRFMLTFSGMPPPGPTALLEVAVMMLKLRKVKNMSVVLETTLAMLQTSGVTFAVYRYSGRLTIVEMLELLADVVGLSGGTNGAKPLVPTQKKLMIMTNMMTVTPKTASVLLMWVLTPAFTISSVAKKVMTTIGVRLKPNELTVTPAPTP